MSNDTMARLNQDPGCWWDIAPDGAQVYVVEQSGSFINKYWLKFENGHAYTAYENGGEWLLTTSPTGITSFASWVSQHFDNSGLNWFMAPSLEPQAPAAPKYNPEPGVKCWAQIKQHGEDSQWYECVTLKSGKVYIIGDDSTEVFIDDVDISPVNPKVEELRRLFASVSAAADIPVTRMFGTSAQFDKLLLEMVKVGFKAPDK